MPGVVVVAVAVAALLGGGHQVAGRVAVLLPEEGHQVLRLGQPRQHPRVGHFQVLMFKRWEYGDRAMVQLVEQ